MSTGFQGLSMIAWTQTLIEGVPAEKNNELAEGMTWRWHGRALPLEGDGAALLLGVSQDHAELRARAARVVRKLLHHPAPTPQQDAALDADPLFADAFVVADGARFYSVVPIAGDGGRLPLLIFPDATPPAGRDLSIVRVNQPRPMDQPEPASIICFTPGTRLRTEHGDMPIEDLGPDDKVLTRDDGPQPVVWTGQSRMSGARLFAMPDLRPVRIRGGALGLYRPDGDLVVSPEHRVLVKGAAARDLWGEAEVLVAARDLVGDRGITVDHSMRETWYVHLMLERHQVIWANGLEVETFHPGFMGLDNLAGGQRRSLLAVMPHLEGDAFRFGAPARRMLDSAEAAILKHGLHGARALH
ncbi:Hint domain-containing protein [Nioella nitratireducens]|uniref:Hint domain-containing protein n=1 Tax=Nioella nitratireducens TaxID=1287720 RepID=UPI0008FD6618|nr:Hint domain-containing protein [Nioella nitratireducens]